VSLGAIWKPLFYHREQSELWECTKRFVEVCAGRGSGKTALSKRRLAMQLAIKKDWADPRYFYASPTYQQAKRIAWDELVSLVPKQWIKSVSHSELCIKTIFGSELWLVGMDKPQRIEGVQWDGGVLDEASDQKPGAVDRSIMPALTWRNGWLWRIGVPKRFGIGALEFKDAFFAAAKGEKEDAAAFTWSSEEVLTEKMLRAAKANLDPVDYAEQFRATWQSIGGGVFHAFSEDYNVRPCSYHEDQPILVGSDFNVDPMAWVLCHRREGRLETFDELWLRNCNTPKALDVLYERYKDHKGGFEFYGDASGKARKTAAVSTDYLLIVNDARFRELGRTVHYLASNPHLSDRFATTNALICNGLGERRYHVDPRCKNLIRDLTSRQYAPGKRELPPDEGDLGHLTDALGYVICKAFPLKLTVEHCPEINISNVDPTILADAPEMSHAA
jgi:hypothetical protein